MFLLGSRRSSTQSNCSVGSSSSSSGSTSSNLEVVAPATSDIEFKFSWTIEGFLKQAKSSSKSIDKEGSDGDVSSGGTTGLDSKPFEININGVRTVWNLSVRFWRGEDGERLANPFVLCLNMLSCNVDKPLEAGIRFRFGVLNRASGDFEMGPAGTKPDLRLEKTTELRSVGYRNIAISEKHIDSSTGDIQVGQNCVHCCTLGTFLTPYMYFLSLACLQVASPEGRYRPPLSLL